MPGPGQGRRRLTGSSSGGSVFGFGDLPVKSLLKSVVDPGYDGFVSLEYEGNEPTLFGCQTGLANARSRLFAELRVDIAGDDRPALTRCKCVFYIYRRSTAMARL